MSLSLARKRAMFPSCNKSELCSCQPHCGSQGQMPAEILVSRLSITVLRQQLS
jgi:hypothetical protein